MTVSGRALPVQAEEDAGALVMRYQQRMRAELLKKAAEEATWAPRWRRTGAATGDYRGGAPTLRERMGSVLHAFTDPRQFVASGLMLALVTAMTCAALLLRSSPGCSPGSACSASG